MPQLSSEHIRSACVSQSTEDSYPGYHCRKSKLRADTRFQIGIQYVQQRFNGAPTQRHKQVVCRAGRIWVFQLTRRFEKRFDAWLATFDEFLPSLANRSEPDPRFHVLWLPAKAIEGMGSSRTYRRHIVRELGRQSGAHLRPIEWGKSVDGRLSDVGMFVIEYRQQQPDEAGVLCLCEFPHRSFSHVGRFRLQLELRPPEHRVLPQPCGQKCRLPLLPEQYQDFAAESKGGSGLHPVFIIAWRRPA